jgi:predicted phage terminase large subunit-like protein
MTEAPLPNLFMLKTETVELYWVNRARKNPADFISYMTGGEKRPARHHLQWMKTIFSDKKRIIIQAWPSSAKAQPLDATIYTPTGPVRMGDLAVGDFVVGVNGQKTKVLGIFPQGEKDIYRVTFTDGSSTECTDDHLWEVSKHTFGRKPVVLPLSEIRKQLREKDGKRIYRIPVANPVEFEKLDLPIDPYLMGVLLGDGNLCSGSTIFSSADSEIIEHVRSALPSGLILKKTSERQGTYDYRITSGVKTGPKVSRNPVTTSLRELGLFAKNSFEKFIPDSYRYSCIEDRVALLQGLLDTDGSANRTCRSQIVFTTVSGALRDQVVELVQSLGGVASLYTPARNSFRYRGEKKVGALSYRVNIKLPPEIVPFRLTRKADIYSPERTRPPSRTIESVEYVGRKQAQCIYVEDERHLYLTDGFIATHNTTITVYSMAWMIGRFPHLTHIVASVSEEQAKQRLSELRDILENPRFQNVFPHIKIDYKRPNNATMLNVWSTLTTNGTEVDYKGWRAFVQQYGEARDHTLFACGVTSRGITGKRCSGWLLIDDPHNETNSATPDQRAKVEKAIKSELLSRLKSDSDYAKAIIIATPWAEDDAIGRLSSSKHLDGTPIWTFLKTPIMDEDGNPAWAEVFPRETIEFLRADRGEILFDMQYMLNPTAAASRQVTLDMMRKALPDPLPEFKEIVVSTDFASTKGTKSDWTVFSAWGKNTEKMWSIYMLDMVRFKENLFREKVKKLAEFCDDIFDKYGKLDRILFEAVDSAAEIQALQEMRPDLPITIIKTKGDKETRFKAAAGWFQQGRVFLNVNATAYPAFCSEVVGFPKASHDDTVDTISLLFQQPQWAVNFERAGKITARSRHMV